MVLLVWFGVRGGVVFIGSVLFRVWGGLCLRGLGSRVVWEGGGWFDVVFGLVRGFSSLGGDLVRDGLGRLLLGLVCVKVGLFNPRVSLSGPLLINFYLFLHPRFLWDPTI